MNSTCLQTSRSHGKRRLVAALFFGALWLPISISFAQNEFGGDGGPLYITAPCTDAGNCSPICGTRGAVTVVDNDPNAGAIYISANDGDIFQAVADGNNPGTYTNTVALEIIINGGNIIIGKKAHAGCGQETK